MLGVSPLGGVWLLLHLMLRLWFTVTLHQTGIQGLAWWAHVCMCCAFWDDCRLTRLLSNHRSAPQGTQPTFSSVEDERREKSVLHCNRSVLFLMTAPSWPQLWSQLLGLFRKSLFPLVCTASEPALGEYSFHSKPTGTQKGCWPGNKILFREKGLMPDGTVPPFSLQRLEISTTRGHGYLFKPLSFINVSV